ncbi:hypothetical protein GCM10010206_55580 [Streptomyces cinerochromogenes]|nr:hypothetical protein GCM10010206_55580 [Streptomyces cinerochromogenes]
MPGELEGRGQRGAHSAGADDADGEPRGAVLEVWLVDCTHATAAFPFQSALGTGRFLVMLTLSAGAATGRPQAVGFATPSPAFVPGTFGTGKPGCRAGPHRA